MLYGQVSFFFVAAETKLIFTLQSLLARESYFCHTKVDNSSEFHNVAMENIVFASNIEVCISTSNILKKLNVFSEWEYHFCNRLKNE